MSEDFGLLYRSTFTGSMVGAGAVAFAVWSYVVANGYGGQVDLNPRLLAATFGEPVEKVAAAIEFHCRPDPDSRTDTDGGRRLRHLGGVSYEIINHEVYKSARALEERKAYNRAKQRESRERKRGSVDVPVLDLSKKSLTDADPLLSSSSDLISSDREGVQGEGPPPAEPEPSKFVPKDFSPTARQRARCAELGHDPDELAGKFRRHEFPHPLTNWELRFDEWIEAEKRPRKPAAAPPTGPKRPPWVDDGAMAFAREHAQDIGKLSKRFRDEHHIPPETLRPGDAKVAFRQFLAKAVEVAA